MEKIIQLKSIVDEAFIAFELECKKVFPDGQLGYYRVVESAEDNKDIITDEMHRTHDEYLEALRDYYLACTEEEAVFHPREFSDKNTGGIRKEQL